LSQAQVMSNLNYLIDQGWVKILNIEKTVTVKGGTIPSTITWYEIAAPGVDAFEGASDFQQAVRYEGININATGSNVITLGDGNVVNVKFKQLHESLTELKTAIAQSSLSEEQKLDMSVDVESIKDQLAKVKPDKTIISHIWSGLEKAAAVAGLVEAFERVRPLIQSLIQ